jgi:hypothetical protein
MKQISRLLIGLAVFGLLVPRVGTASPPDKYAPAGAQKSLTVAIADVKLAEDGVLRGQVVNREGTAKAGAKVTLVSSGQVVAQAVTDQQGRFAMPVAKGGVYALTDGENGAVVRVWTNAAAPPSAQAGILLVSDGALVRANLGDGGLMPILGLAAIAGVVVAVVIAATDDDDAS